MFSDLVEIEESSEENDDDFYKNKSSEDENKQEEDNEAIELEPKQNKKETAVDLAKGTIPGSKPGVPTKLGPSLLQT